jgi:parallel beta-helix repeat protein
MPARHPARPCPRGLAAALAPIAACLLLLGLVPSSATASVSAAACPSSAQSLIDKTATGGSVTIPACVFHASLKVGRAMTIHAAGATIDGDDTRSTGVTVTGNNVTIDGLTVQGVHSDDHVGAVNLESGDNFTFKNGVIRNSSTVCIGLHGGSGAKVLDSELTGCGKEGYFLNGMSDTLFRGNRIHDNNVALKYDWFVEAGGGKTMASNHVTFDGNEVYANRGPGIWFDNGAKNAVITNNRIHDNNREGIFFEISSGASISGNAVWNNGWSFAAWGYGAGITVSSSDGAAVSNNTVAWNARGISVISQARQLSPHDHDTIRDNVIVSAKGGFVAGFYDDHGGTLFNSANANGGSGNRYWVGAAEPTDSRFQWNGGIRTLGGYNNTRGEEGGSYLSTSARDAALGAAGIPAQNGAPLPGAAPRKGDPRFTIGGSRLGRTGVLATVRWSRIAVADAYQLQLQHDGGSWSAVRLASRRSLSAGVVLAVGHDYRARLRLHTQPSTWSPWNTSPAIEAKRYQESSSLVDYGPGRWTGASVAGASGGHVRYAKGKGAAATLRFTGRAVAWVSTVGPSRGSARVYVDGHYRTTVNLHRSSTTARQIVFRAAWSSRATHSLVIRVVGTDGHPRVDVDAFAVLD